MAIGGSRSEPLRRKPSLNVVLFSGGRGSSVLSKQLINDREIALTIAVNGYDDGASTGEVRRFLGDSLGPSDFRKNASRIAAELRSSAPELIELLDTRLPAGCSEQEATALFRIVDGAHRSADGDPEARFQRLAGAIEETARREIASRLALFEQERARTGRPFQFSDCSLGNLVFAGSFLQRRRDFNAAIDDYCGLLGLRPGLVDNVTDGANAFLVALDLDDRLLGSEGEIVDAKRRNRIKEIYLIDPPLEPPERERLAAAGAPAILEFLDARAKAVTLNPRLRDRLTAADLIIYSPGTQHSSLFPSYLTPGLSGAVARNLTAIKLLITNIQTDAEIAGSSAVDIVERATYYLKEKGRLGTPTPCLITHYLMNDPGRAEVDAPYVPLGRLDTLEDPRLVRIGNYEEGVTGRHDAAKILTPFLQSFLTRRAPQKVAVLLQDSDSPNKLTQTILEMVRGGIRDVPVDIVVFHDRPEPLDRSFAASLPFPVRSLAERGEQQAGRWGVGLGRILLGERFDYVILFESSGMYRGEDIVSLASPLGAGRLDAVWGSRRLSVRDIHESYRLRYRHNLVLGTISYLGSHALSLAYLTLYGRYISDTLSGARAIRAAYVRSAGIDLIHKQVNQHLLSSLLRGKAELLETPVRFFPLSPERVRRTSTLDGLQSLLTIFWWRFKVLAPRPRDVAEAPVAERTDEARRIGHI